ncbi:MAG: Mut7-C RNAse domain-containing protein [Planctomycetota bacterium]
MHDEGHPAPAFACDAMLGGLTRWLRAAGYDAHFEGGIEDAQLVDLARRTRRILLSSDRMLFERREITTRQVEALYIPQQLSKTEQLAFALMMYNLPRREPRCMACGGTLQEVPKHRVAGEAPPLAFRNCERFWRCVRCGRLLWRGTHWNHIDRRLAEVAQE